jgi:hypothetical protein
MVNPKHTVKSIKIDKDKLEYLQNILNSNNVGPAAKRRLQVQIVGECAVCGSIPTKIISRKVEDATVIRKYCDKHYVK